MAPVVLEQLGDTRFQCVVDGVQSILASIIGESGTPRLAATGDECGTCNGVISVISLVGAVEWALMFNLSETTAPRVAERFTGFPIPFASADMGDAMGELANLLAGEIKVELDRVGVKANISLPQVFRGSQIEVLQLDRVNPVVIIFETSLGPIFAAIASSQA